MAGEGVGVSERVARTTISQWSKMVSEQTIDRYILLKMLQSKGLIKYGNSGGEMRWVVRYRDHALKGFPDNAPISFGREHTLLNAKLPWRGYHLTDAITLREKLEQGGKEAMIKVFSNREEVMRRAAGRQLSGEWFKDGNLAANAAAETFHGIESFMGQTGHTDTNVLCVTQNDTYAGLSTAISGITGATNSKMWTPVIVHTADNANTWTTSCDEYIRKLLIEACYGAGPEDNQDLILLTKDSYEILLNKLDDKERLNFRRGEGTAVAKFGFDKFVEFDGCSIGWDAGVPSTDTVSGVTNTVRGYSFNTNRMKLKVLGGGKSLFKGRVTFNDNYQADHIFLYLLGNLVFESPRHFGKLADLG